MDKIKAIKRLKALAKGAQPYSAEYGICLDLSRNGYIKGALELSPYFKTWEFFSGDEVYPVPGSSGLSPIGAFCTINNLWKGEQGWFRRDLCKHIANEMTKEIKNDFRKLFPNS